MKRATVDIACVLLLLISGVSSAEEEITTIPLSYCEGNDVLKLFWPQKDLGKSKLLKNPVNIYGTDVPIKTKQDGPHTTYLTFEYANESHKKTYNNRPIGLIIPGKLGDQQKNLPVIFANVDSDNRTHPIWATLLPGWMMKGEVNKKFICLIDANCDGKFDTEGNDCIAINSRYAMRLSKRTSIDGKFYDVEVKPDGSEIKLKNIKPKNVGKVTLNEGFKGWEVLSLTNDKATYNIAADNCDVIPAGKYHIDYGIYAAGVNYASLLIDKDFDPELDILRNRLNIINIGAPFSLFYKVTFKMNRVIIKPYLAIAGCFGERYAYHTVPNKQIVWGIRGAIFDGRKNTKTKPITFACGANGDESGRIDAKYVINLKVVGVSVTSGNIVTSTRLPGFDRLEGKVIFSEGESPKPEKQVLIEYKFPKD